MEDITLFGITITIIAILSVTIVLYAIRAAKNKKLKRELQDLDIEKNNSQEKKDARAVHPFGGLSV